MAAVKTAQKGEQLAVVAKAAYGLVVGNEGPAFAVPSANFAPMNTCDPSPAPRGGSRMEEKCICVT
jgi:hypothetical protein